MAKLRAGAVRKVCRMRKAVEIDQALLDRIRLSTGIADDAALVDAALRAFVAGEAARRLIALAGSDPTAEAAPRRRPDYDSGLRATAFRMLRAVRGPRPTLVRR